MKANITIDVDGYEPQTITIELTPLDHYAKPKGKGPRGPYLSKEKRETRNDEIVRMYNAGYSIIQCAKQNNVSSEWVRRILHERNVFPPKKS